MYLERLEWVHLREGLTAYGLEATAVGDYQRKPRENTPTGYLARVRPDLRKARDTVASYLASSKHDVRSATPYLVDPGKFLAALEAELDHSAHMSAQLSNRLLQSTGL